MKNCKTICSLLIALVLLCSTSVCAFAQTPPHLIEPPPAVSSQLESEAAVPMEPLPEAVEITSEPSDTEPSGLPSTPDRANEAETQEEAVPAPHSSNTPYFVGAVIAVLVLIGVTLYCKFNSRK